MAVTAPVITRTLFRACLRAVRRLEAAAASASRVSLDDDSLAPLPALSHAQHAHSTASEAAPGHWRRVVRSAFDENRAVPPEMAAKLTDAALAALHQANLRATQLERTSVRKPSSVHVRVGDVVHVHTCTHGQAGWSGGDGKVPVRGVVVGYDAECAASPSWIASSGVPSASRHRPWVHVAVCARALAHEAGSDAAQTTSPLSAWRRSGMMYVPQDALQAVPPSTPASERLVLNPRLSSFFTHFHTDTGEYTPSAALAELYVEDCSPSLEAIVAAARQGGVIAARQHAPTQMPGDGRQPTHVHAAPVLQ